MRTKKRSHLLFFLLFLFPLGSILSCNWNDSDNETCGAGYYYDKETGSCIPDDTDGDGINDIIEAKNGTDPKNADSDGDGLTDLFEMLRGKDNSTQDVLKLKLKTGMRADEGTITDSDGDGKIAALDADDNNDGIHDGLDDIDGDGIPNAYEYYGFSISGFNRDIAPWGVDHNKQTGQLTVKSPDQLDYTVKYYKTNPHQASTDGDPYTDSFEAKGVNMDQAVINPGRNPSVPAFPKFYVEMDSYSITMLEDIVSTAGGSNSWTNTVSKSSQTGSVSGLNWLGNSFAAGAFRTALGKVVEPNINTNTVTNSNSGVSDWSKVTSTKSDAAAKIKLNIKVTNYGSAPAYNVMPIVTLFQGRSAIATFKPNASIAALAAGDTYPSGPGNFWNVDKRVGATGEESDILLSVDELRSFEIGAPFYLAVTDVTATVKLPVYDEALHVNVLTDIGRWPEYSPGITTNAATVVVDSGDGHYANHLVYAGDPVSDFSPPITVRDALYWLLGNYGGGSFTSYVLSFPDGTSSIELAFDKEKWGIILDSNYTQRDFQKAGSDPLNVCLKPRTVVYIKAAPDDNNSPPPISWAAMSPVPVPDMPVSTDAITDQFPKQIAAAVSDYFEVKEVYMLSSINGSTKYAMTDDDADSVYTAHLPKEYVPTGSETVIASNIDNFSSQRSVSFTAPVGITRKLHGDMKTTAYFDLDKNVAGNSYYPNWFEGWDVRFSMFQDNDAPYWMCSAATTDKGRLFVFDPSTNYDALTYEMIKNKFVSLESNPISQWPYFYRASMRDEQHEFYNWVFNHPFYFQFGTTICALTDEGNLAKIRIDKWESHYNSDLQRSETDAEDITYMLFKDLN